MSSPSSSPVVLLCPSHTPSLGVVSSLEIMKAEALCLVVVAVRQ